MNSTSDNSCNDKESGTSKANDYVCDVNNMLQNMSTAADEDIVSTVNNTEDVGICANCGKEGDDINNICNKCKQVNYCNAACKKKHKQKHKKQCEEFVRLAAEQAAEKHDDELFRQPPPAEDCPICFIRIPTLHTGSTYFSCCGKTMCSGCAYAPVYDDQGNEVAEEKCPFCRTPAPNTDDEAIKRYKKRVELDDPLAIFNLGIYYRDGTNGFSQDHAKALELYHRAGDLGYAQANSSIGYAYDYGQGVKVDKKKAKHYCELAAMKGDEVARHNLGNFEWKAGNMKRALNHFMIAVRSGEGDSMKQIKKMYTDGHATKKDYTKALQLYQTYLSEIKSVQRDEAAVFDEEYQYY